MYELAAAAAAVLAIDHLLLLGLVHHPLTQETDMLLLHTRYLRHQLIHLQHLLIQL